MISAGGLIGEYSGRQGKPSASLYRTVSYVCALKRRKIRILASSVRMAWKTKLTVCSNIAKLRADLALWRDNFAAGTEQDREIDENARILSGRRSLEDVPADSTFIGDSG